MGLEDRCWQSVVVFLWEAFVVERCVGLAARLVLELYCMDFEYLLEDEDANEGIEGVDSAEHEEHGLLLRDCEREDRDGHPDFVTLLKNSFG